jgi:hypothetical protein
MELGIGVPGRGIWQEKAQPSWRRGKQNMGLVSKAQIYVKQFLSLLLLFPVRSEILVISESIKPVWILFQF